LEDPRGEKHSDVSYDRLTNAQLAQNCLFVKH